MKLLTTLLLLITLTASAQFEGFVPFKQSAFGDTIYVKSGVIGNFFFSGDNPLLDFNGDGNVTKYDNYLWSSQYFGITWFPDLEYVEESDFDYLFLYNYQEGGILPNGIFEEQPSELYLTNFLGELTDDQLYLWTIVGGWGGIKLEWWFINQ